MLSPDHKLGYARYGLAAALAIATLLLRGALIPVIGTSTPYITLFPVMMLVTISLGMGPGLLGNGLGILIVEFYLGEPIENVPLGVSVAIRSAIALLTTVYVGRVGDNLRRSRRQAEDAAAAHHASDEQLRQTVEKHAAELEQRVAERTAEVERQRHTLFHVLEQLPAMICLLTPDYHVPFANPASQEKFGEPGGRRCFEYSFGRKEPCDGCQTLEVLKSGEPQHGEMNGPDGRIVAAHYYPFTDADGSPLILKMGIDITDQRRVEAELKELNEHLEKRVAQRTDALAASEHRLRFALETSHIGAWDLDLIDHTAFRSPEHDRIFGYTEPLPQWTYELFLDHVLPVDRARVDAEFLRAKATGGDWKFECRIRRADGAIRWVGAAGQHLRDADGRPSRMTGIVQDITERRLAEDALRQSEERFQLSMEATNDGLWDWNVETDEVYYSPAYYRILDYEPGSFPGTANSWVELTHPDDRIRVLRVNGECIEGRCEHFDVEFRMKARNGDWRWILGRGKCVSRDEHGRATRMVGTHIDITDRKRAEEALRHSEAKYRHLHQSMMDAFVSVDMAGVIREFNDSFRQMLDYEPEELLSLRYYDLTPERWHVLEDAIVRNQILVKGYSEPYEKEYRRKDGSVFPVELRTFLLRDDAGEPSGMWAIVRDITVRKQAEAALKAAKEAAEAANLAKSRFLANLSHEVRTPMNAILGMIDLALRKALAPVVRDYLETAHGSASVLLHLLDELLDSAKIEAGRLELEWAPFRLRRMLDEITPILSVRASQKDVALRLRVAEGTPEAVVGDRTRLQQVLLNLAGNAIKFTERGEVEIAVEARLRDGEADLEFAVRDTGIGIDPSRQEEIFQPFVQADASTTRRFGGTGLGLSICKSLVELMGGRIWQESVVGQGSTFHFTVRLPIATAVPEDGEVPAAAPSEPRAPLHVLLVEDNPANQKLATHILQERGHAVEVAESGDVAVAMAAPGGFDVVLMDVEVPGMDGLEATAAIRAAEGDGRRLPIIALTAYAQPSDRERCLAAGMDGYLVKPIDAREMIALVEKYAAGQDADNESSSLAGRPATRRRGPSPAIFDPAAALKQCLDREDLLSKIVHFFFDDAEKLLPAMHAALQQRDLVTMGRLGHRLKGTISHLAAEPALEAARRVEQLGRSGSDPSDAEPAFRLLQQECESLKAALRRHQV